MPVKDISGIIDSENWLQSSSPLSRSSSANSTARVQDLRSTSVVSFSTSICLSPSLCRCTLDRKWLEQEQLCYGSTAPLMAIDNIKVALDSIIQARLVCCIKHTPHFKATTIISALAKNHSMHGVVILETATNLTTFRKTVSHRRRPKNNPIFYI